MLQQLDRIPEKQRAAGVSGEHFPAWGPPSLRDDMPPSQRLSSRCGFRMGDVIAALDDEQGDLLFKYVYRGLEVAKEVKDTPAQPGEHPFPWRLHPTLTF